MFHVEHVANSSINQVFFISDETKQLPSNHRLVNLDKRGGTNSDASKVQTNGCRGGGSIQQKQKTIDLC
jgi:hypothetical protein